MSGVVVKIGTSSLTNEDGVIDRAVVAKVAAEVAMLRSEGIQVTIVTSGAIAAGMPIVGVTAAERPTNAVELQALSSICLLYTSPSPRDQRGSRMPSSA